MKKKSAVYSGRDYSISYAFNNINEVI